MNEIRLSEFLSAFVADRNETIYLRTIGAKGSERIASLPFETTWGSYSSDITLQKNLKAANLKSGIYFVVNSGGNKDGDITKFNAFFVENDELSIEEQHKVLDAYPIQPSIRIETKKSVHAYWLIKGNCSEAEWRDIQNRLITYFNSDNKIRNPSRLMRLPEFNHVSYNPETNEYSPKKVELVGFDKDRRFTVEEMMEAFPSLESQKEPILKHDGSSDQNESSLTLVCDKSDNVTSNCTEQNFETWNELNMALGMKIMEQGTRASNGNFQMRCPVHNGQSQTSLFYDPQTNATYCSSGNCSHTQVLEAFNLPNKPINNKSESKQSQACLLVGLASDADLFTSQNDEPFATITNKGHKETWSIDSRSFKDWLGRKFYQTYQNVASENSLKEALSTLAGKAKFDGEQKQVHLRRAEFEGAIYLDLVNEDWQVVKISADGWEITSDCPVKFRRTRGMKALPLPVKGGKLCDLDKFLNIHGDDLKLAKVWLASTLMDIQYPVLVFSGQQNCGKSTSATVLVSISDPNIANLVAKPRSIEDLYISVSNRGIVAFDNLSHISDEFSDALCQIATGGAFTKRKNYSDADEVILTAKNPLILTGIGDIATKGDLLSRSIIINPPTIKDRISETDFWNNFKELQPKILGALLDAVSEGLKNYYFVKIENCQARMLDFVKFGTALEEHLGIAEGNFVQICNKNYESASKIAVENNPIAILIHQLIQRDGMFWGCATDLLGNLYALADDVTIRNPGFPKSPQRLSNLLDRLAPSFRTEGIEIDKGDHLREGGTGSRRIKITKLENHLSHSSHPSQNYPSQPF